MKEGMTMGASYWSRWACSGQIDELPEMILSLLLDDGFELISHDTNRQVFDCGGMMSKLNWNLRGGDWHEAPLDLTVTYAYSPAQTIANFYWRLTTSPLPVTTKEQAAFEAQIQQRLGRITTYLNEQVLATSVDAREENTPGGATLKAYWEDARRGDDVASVLGEPAFHTLNRISRLLDEAAPCSDEAIRCDLCHRAAVPVPGTSNRHFCLRCRHHLTRHPFAC